MIPEHDQAALRTDVPEEGLIAGNVGTVISVHKGGEAYTVEFMTLQGETVAIVILLAAQVRALTAREMHQARSLPPSA